MPEYDDDVIFEEEYEGPYDDADYEDPAGNPELDARLEAVQAQLDSLNGHDPADQETQFIEAQINELEERIGSPLDDETTSLIGRLAQQNRDEDGDPSVDNALAVLGQQEHQFESGFGEDAGRLERDLGRTLTQREVDQLWERSSQDGNPNARETWKELHPDGKDPFDKLSRSGRTNYMAERFRDEAEQEKQEQQDAAGEVKKSDFDLSDRKGRVAYMQASYDGRIVEPEAGPDEPSNDEAQED